MNTRALARAGQLHYKALLMEIQSRQDVKIEMEQANMILTKKKHFINNTYALLLA